VRKKRKGQDFQKGNRGLLTCAARGERRGLNGLRSAVCRHRGKKKKGRSERWWGRGMMRRPYTREKREEEGPEIWPGKEKRVGGKKGVLRRRGKREVLNWDSGGKGGGKRKKAIMMLLGRGGGEIDFVFSREKKGDVELISEARKEEKSWETNVPARGGFRWETWGIGGRRGCLGSQRKG